MTKMHPQPCKGSLILLMVVGLNSVLAIAQQPQGPFSHPPTSFSAEDATFPQAVPLPGCVRRLLASDRDVVIALRHENLSPEQLPPEWFTASEQKLGQNKGTYLVVMGAGRMRGANINPFWIFWKSPKSCHLVLSVGAHDIEVLKTKTNGLPDVKVAAETAVRYFENQYKFDGNNYRVIERTSQPIGEEIPRNLSDLETRKPLVQEVGQRPEPILAEARAWLWQQWWLKKPSYLTMTLHSIEGDETTTTYFISRTDNSLEVTIHIHRTLVDRIPPFRYPTVEDEIVVATDVERRLFLKNNPDRKTKVPEGQEASSDSYELFFNDDQGNNLAIL